jgi:hypothetical protein
MTLPYMYPEILHTPVNQYYREKEWVGRNTLSLSIVPGHCHRKNKSGGAMGDMLYIERVTGFETKIGWLASGGDFSMRYFFRSSRDVDFLRIQHFPQYAFKPGFFDIDLTWEYSLLLLFLFLLHVQPYFHRITRFTNRSVSTMTSANPIMHGASIILAQNESV